ncbi:MAG: molecular chaperone DnaJ [Pleurocapsa sp.]
MARQKSFKQQTPTPSSLNPTLAPSNFHLRLQALEKEHQWLLKQISRKQTELQNFLEQMRSLAAKIMQQGEPFYQQLIELDREIHHLFATIFATRKFGKQSLKNIRGIYRNLQMTGIISPKIEQHEELEDLFDNLKEEFFEEDTAEFQAHHRHRPFEESFPTQAEAAQRSAESKHIRQTFLHLASIFHPDKVTDTDVQMYHNEIMKEVNRAYNEGDIAKLLEIQRQHSIGNTIAIDNSSLSNIEKLCQRKEADNQILKTQYENLKQELREIRHTPEGQAVKEFRFAVRQGLDPIGEMLTEIKAQVEEIAEIRDFVRDFKDKKLTIKRFLQGPSGMNPDLPEDLDDIIEQIMGEMITVIRL